MHKLADFVVGDQAEQKAGQSANQSDWNQPAGDDVVTPLTKSEAETLRRQNPSLSPWVALAGQAGGGLLTAVVCWLTTGQVSIGWSALYGGAAVVLPGALFARGLTSRVTLMNPAAAVTGFFLWEMVKIGLVLAMLFAAPKLVSNLSWPAMLIGLVVTMKVVWLVIWLEAKVRRKSN